MALLPRAYVYTILEKTVSISRNINFVIVFLSVMMSNYFLLDLIVRSWSKEQHLKGFTEQSPQGKTKSH